MSDIKLTSGDWVWEIKSDNGMLKIMANGIEQMVLTADGGEDEVTTQNENKPTKGVKLGTTPYETYEFFNPEMTGSITLYDDETKAFLEANGQNIYLSNVERNNGVLRFMNTSKFSLLTFDSVYEKFKFVEVYRDGNKENAGVSINFGPVITNVDATFPLPSQRRRPALENF